MILGSIQGLSDRKCIVHVKVYLPCALIVVLSWVGFWLNREATSDRVTLGNSLHAWLHIYPRLSVFSPSLLIRLFIHTSFVINKYSV